MNFSPLVICYPSFSGNINIRTIRKGDLVLASLEDVVRALVSENSALAQKFGRHSLNDLIKAAAGVLDEDEKEFVDIPEDRSNEPRQETFVTEPGLYRIVTQDSSPSCKKFQRWLFHEVLPSIRKYGTFPPPSKSGGSEIKILAQRLAENTNLLIREIDEREKLERKTMEGFSRAERKLEDLSYRVEQLEQEQPDVPYVTIESHCSEIGIRKIDHQFLLAWCNKICLERSIKTRNFMFPPDVIDEAISMVKQSTRRAG